MSQRKSTMRAVRVLLVGDGSKERLVLRRLLSEVKGASHEILEAEDVEGANAPLPASPPECVLLNCDRLDDRALKRLAEIVAAYGIHACGIVIVTDAATEEETEKALRSGAHEVLPKQALPAAVLVQSVRNAIRKAALLREQEISQAELTRKNQELERRLMQHEREGAERRSAELALAGSEAFLQSVIGATTDCVQVLDLEGRVLWMSKNGQRMMALEDFSKIAGVEWAAFWTQEDKVEQARAVVAAAREGKEAHFQGRCRTFADVERWWDVSLSPIKNRAGRPERILCVARDVSDRHFADEALRESEARLRLATATGKVGVWDWDIPKDKVTWTESLYGIHGMNPGTFAGTLAAFAERIHPEDKERVERAFGEALTGGGCELEFRAIRADGGVVWLFASATVVRSEGTPVRMLGATLDITERKRVERHTEFLSHLGQELSLLSDPQEMMRVAQARVGTHLDVQRCSFLEIEGTSGRAVVHDDWRGTGTRSLGGEYSLDEYGTASLVEGLVRERLGVSDVVADPLTSGRAESYLRLGVRAFATAPYHREGRTIAVLGVGSGAVRRWRDDELGLLEQAVARVWPHVEKARADRLLIDSAEQLRLAATVARLGPWSYDGQTDMMTLSARAAEIFGIPPGQLVSWTKLREFLHDEDRERIREATERSLAQRTEYAVEYRVIRPDGKMVWVAATGHGQYDADGRLSGMVGVVQDITVRKEAELATRQLAVIVESSDDAIISKNLQSIILTWNSGAERIFGYKAHEIIGLPITLLIPPENYNEEPLILERIRRGESVETYETVRRHKSGRMVDVSITVSPIRDQKGAIVGASKIARDISRRKAIETALARRTRILEILNRAGEALVAERELEKIVQTVAGAGREITGAEFGGFFYDNLDNKEESVDFYTFSGVAREAFEKRSVPRDDVLLGPIVRGEGIVRIDDAQAELSGGKDDGEKPWPGGLLPARSFLAAPVKSGGGPILGGLFFGHAEPAVFTQEAVEGVEALAAQAAIAIDNVRLYRAVQRELAEHKQARETVRAREQQLRLVTNNAPVFLLQCDREYRYTFANQPYAARYGFTPETLLGRTISEVAGPAAFEAARTHIDAALAGERVEFEMEIPYDTIGSRWVHLVFVPERDSAGNVRGFVGVLTDITQRKSAELELERARDEALAASRAKDDFLAALSHELRTPLNPVLLLASDAAENNALAPEVRDAFETIRRQVNLEARLIDDLLDLTRITRGKLRLERRTLDAHTVLNEALTTVRPDLESKGLTLSVHLDAPERTIFGDPVRLQQVFWNVLKNAVKFTGERGRITVRTHDFRRTSRFAVTVEDTGIGMTPEELDRVFEAFSQGDHASSSGSHRFGGLGLGLAISRSIVEMHGGQIRAESAGRNRGAVFTIKLPLMSVPTSAGEFPDKDNGAISIASDASGVRGRLLVIEDHAPTRTTLKNLLERRNFEVLVAASAADARVLAQQPLDLVISDIGLPDLDGCTLMVELRQAHPELPGIALSGYGMDEDLARTRAAGFVEHLTKPVNVGALERAIEKILSSKPR